MKTSVINEPIDDLQQKDQDYKIEFLPLRRRLIILFVVAAVLLASTLTLFNLQFSKLIDEKDDLSHVINISGRQRMLSQNITKTSLLLIQGDQERARQLDSLRRLFAGSHKELLTTNESLKSAPLDSQFNLISTSFEGLYSVSGQLLEGRREVQLEENLLRNEELFLPQMDAIVNAYEIIGTKAFESTNHSVKLSLYLIIAFVILSGITVYLVAIRIIEKYSKELSQKTSELDLAKLEIEKVKLKEQFAFVASHDLQEPIRTILSLTDLMSDRQRKQLDDEGKKMLDFIKQSGERMTEHIKGLLDYSRLGRDQVLEVVNLNDILKEVTQDLRVQVEESHVVIVKDELPEVVGYKLELRSIFQNLISNAIKFSKESETPKVSISYTETDKEWIFSVTDNGIGMNSKHSKKIFKLFQRLNNRGEYAGMGIGLALCKHIVELHKGTIWVETAPQKGSTFSFTLRKGI